MMGHLPVFFYKHELNGDADERVIKRAYAKSLKLIDQETDLAGFQALRDSYEEALEWARLHGKLTGFVVQEEPGVHLEPALEIEKVKVNADPAHDAPLNEFAHEQKNDPLELLLLETKHEEGRQQAVEQYTDLIHPWRKGQSPIENSEEVAQALFDKLLQELAKQNDVEGSAESCLLNILGDGHQISIWSSHAFEHKIATYVIEGWHVGDGDLLDAAIKYFEWDKRKQDLFNFGQVGQVLNKALLEREMFLAKDQKTRDQLWMILRKVRTDGNPDHKFLKANFDLLVHMVQSYPVWLYMVTSRKNLTQWYVKVNSKHSDAAADYLKEKHKVTTTNDIKNRFGPITGLLLILIVIFIAGKTYQKSRTQASAPPASNVQKLIKLSFFFE